MSKVVAIVLAAGLVPTAMAPAAIAADGQGFNLNASDLRFILKQIKIAEQHAATQTASNPCGTLRGPGANQIPAGENPEVTESGAFFIPNVAPDVGLSAPYNSWFTLFGQFFDHGVDQTVKGNSGTVFVPLRADDPLVTVGPDGKADTGDEVPEGQRFMVLTRAQNQPGPDGIVGDRPGTPEDESADDVQNATNTDSPWVDQSQTYTSHPSHQVFLREYALNAGPDGIAGNADDRPVDTGALLGGIGNGATGMATWESTKKQAAELLGLKLVDRDATNVPMLATDPYGNFIRGPARGLPQYATETGLVEGNRAAPVPVRSAPVSTGRPAALSWYSRRNA